MASDDRPIDGSEWGAWVRAGAERWETVQRSWVIFRRNTDELVEVVNRPRGDLALVLKLMGEDREATQPFWDELDQRLHNQAASAVTLVDHTRRLINYYGADAEAMIAEYGQRNQAVRQMREASFLRDLRNYLLHSGVAPVLQTMKFQAGGATATDIEHEIKLSAALLLRWDGWSAASRAYLTGFGDRDGPVLGRDIVAYANAMAELYTWLLGQRLSTTAPTNIPDRFRMDPQTR